MVRGEGHSSWRRYTPRSPTGERENYKKVWDKEEGERVERGKIDICRKKKQ